MPCSLIVGLKKPSNKPKNTYCNYVKLTNFAVIYFIFSPLQSGVHLDKHPYSSYAIEVQAILVSNSHQEEYLF